MSADHIQVHLQSYPPVTFQFRSSQDCVPLLHSISQFIDSMFAWYVPVNEPPCPPTALQFTDSHVHWSRFQISSCYVPLLYFISSTFMFSCHIPVHLQLCPPVTFQFINCHNHLGYFSSWTVMLTATFQFISRHVRWSHSSSLTAMYACQIPVH